MKLTPEEKSSLKVSLFFFALAILLLMLTGCGQQEDGGGTVLGSEIDHAVNRCGPQGVDFFTMHNGEPYLLYCVDGRTFEKYRWVNG